MKRLTVLKGHILQHKGELNSKVYVVKSGLLRSYYLDTLGKEHTFMFAPENWVIADSLSGLEPCDLFIDALEDSVVLVFTKDKDEEKHPDKLIRRLSVLQKRIIMLMSATALERYDHFLETYPEIVQRVSQRLIASYLAVTPEALSRAKKERLARNKPLT